VAAKPPCAFGNALAKFDVRDGEAVLWHEGGAIPGEPVMVPRPGAQARPQPCMLSRMRAGIGFAHLQRQGCL
jgi:carotenoid cleavage dioxygenase-like enzyme